METEFNEFNESLKTQFSCSICDFNCSYISDWRRHISTRKHILNNNGNTKKHHSFSNKYTCKCGNTYTTNSGLWKHKKKCEDKDKEDNDVLYKLPKDFKITPQMFYDLLKQNNELHKSLIALDQEKISTTISNCGNNNNNKTFNLQIYLNETCKDALNITEFVNQIQLTINDLEETGKLGYAEGISRVLLKNLNGIDSTRRPIHCSNSKKEIFYIKDSDEWHKEDETKPLLTKAIKQVANKNMKQITEWQKLYPEYNNPNSKQNDKYMQIVLNSMSGSTNEEAKKNYEKIIKNVVKETLIDKK